MSETLQPLIADLVAWVAKEPRPYSEVMDAWRTSCPRLPVWEEAVARGYVVRRRDPKKGALVVATARGRDMLAAGRSTSSTRKC